MGAEEQGRIKWLGTTLNQRGRAKWREDAAGGLGLFREVRRSISGVVALAFQSRERLAGGNSLFAAV